MDLVCALYGSFANPKHGKGMESYYALKAAYDKGYVQQIFATSSVGSSIPNDIISCPLPGGDLIPKLLKGIQFWVYPGLQARFLSEEMFDRHVACALSKCDVFLAYGAGMPRSIQRAKELGAVTIIQGATAAGNYNTPLLQEEAKRWGLKKSPFLGRMVDAEFCEQVDYVFAFSEFVKKTYEHAGVSPERIKVVSLGVDTQRFKPAIKRDDVFRCLCVGHMGIIKGLGYLLQAWDELRLENAELVICGNISPEVRSLVKTHERKNSTIRTTGAVDPVPYYQNASLFILSSLSEGFPKVVLEAMACGLPVIVTEPCAVCVNDGVEGYGVPVRDVEAIKEKILFFYKYPDRGTVMGPAAREKALSYSWQKYSDAMCRLYEEVYALSKGQRA